MLEIDGSFGEGGGQIIRSSLALSLATGTPFRAVNVRARRSRPGLQRQHLTALRAAAEVGAARVTGDELHSREFTFVPGTLQPGDYRFDIGTAGSTMLLLQTLLPVLIAADAPSRLTLQGGTHNLLAPPFEFVERTLVPLLNRLGPHISLDLDRPGFYPVGGGKVRVEIEPAPLQRLELLERGKQQSVQATATVSKLPVHIARRELKVVAGLLSLKSRRLHIVDETRSPGPGNVVSIVAVFENVTEVFTGFGERGKPAERVAREAAKEAKRYLDGIAPVGEHLADQLLLPLALGGGGAYRTFALTPHSTTNIDTIQKFLDVDVDVLPPENGAVEVRVRGR